MSRRSLELSNGLYDYLLGVSLREPELLRRLREETAGLEQARMQIAPEQGQFMALLVKLMGARQVLEVGTFTGYSALVVALALPSTGGVVTCDVSEEWTTIARRYWREAGVAEKIDLRLGPASDMLEALVAERGRGSFDFAFVDADKENYARYYELALELVRGGGLIALDNVLWGGRVADPDERSEATEAIRAVNRRLHTDRRVDISLVPIGDGLTLAVKRADAG